MTSQYNKPLPFPSEETERFWEGTKKHELWIPYCNSCKSFYFYPRVFCPKCFSWDVDWRRASGKGTLYTYGIQYRPAGPGFYNDVPYITAIVELEEGVRLMTNLVDVEPDPAKIKIDAPVEVVFDDVTDEVTLPKFRFA
jgi:uncharacterized OB-fold protein